MKSFRDGDDVGRRTWRLMKGIRMRQACAKGPKVQRRMSEVKGKHKYKKKRLCHALLLNYIGCENETLFLWVTLGGF